MVANLKVDKNCDENLINATRLDGSTWDIIDNDSDRPVPIIEDSAVLSPEEHLHGIFGLIEIESRSGAILTYEDKVDRLYLALSGMNQVEMETKHLLTPGLYTREATAPAGSMLISKTHLKEHQFIMSKGVCYTVMENGDVVKMVAPLRGITKPGTRRVCLIAEETTWTSIHPTSETDINKIEAELYKEDSLLISENPDHLDFYAMADEVGVIAERIRAESRNPDTLIPMPDGCGLKIEVRNSAIEGMGQFSVSDIESGELIAPAAIGGMRTPAGRFTNHSANPNSIMALGDNGDVNLIASKPITKGTEVTLDYRQARLVAIESTRIMSLK